MFPIVLKQRNQKHENSTHAYTCLRTHTYTAITNKFDTGTSDDFVAVSNNNKNACDGDNKTGTSEVPEASVKVA